VSARDRLVISLFNGDFVDRGSFSIEVIMLFFSFKLLYPTSFHILRGNHETLNMNQIYGFQGEVNAKVETACFELFSEAFNLIPLAACIQKKVLVVHGGLFSDDNVTLDQIRAIDRNQQPPESGLLTELLWSDPQKMKGRAPSKRGVGLSFGPDVTANFLKNNGLELIIRSHEVKDDGFEMEHNDQLITVFSAPNYCDQMVSVHARLRRVAVLVRGPDELASSFDPHPSLCPVDSHLHRATRVRTSTSTAVT
jgi:serine/threonine-protein phosphatase 5